MQAINGKSSFHQPEKIIYHFLMILAIAVGIYVRLKGLGKWPLATDEYYFAKSVNNILATGLPGFQCGGYYTRGILQQYIVAPLMLLFSDHQEFALRIVPLICNLLAVPPLYWLGKKLSGNFAACAVVILFSFSLWEIEFARFARMYSPFQAIFLWYVYFLYQAIVEKNVKSEVALLILSFISLFLYEGSVFLLFLNFFPLLYKDKPLRIDSLLLLRIAIFIVGYFYLTTDFRRIGVEHFIPADITVDPYKDSSAILLPTLLIQDLGRGFLAAFGAPVILFLVAAWALFKLNIEARGKLILFAGLLCALFNQFGLLAACLTSYALIKGIDFKLLIDKKFRIYLATVTAFFIFWLSFGYFSDNWFHYFTGLDTFSFHKYLVLLLKYPNCINTVLYPWLHTIPILTTCLFLGIFPVLMLACLKPERNDLAGIRLVFMMLFSVVIVMGVINTNYLLTRYTFFFYPLVSLLFVCAVSYFARIVTKNSKLSDIFSILVLIMFMWLSEDFSLAHMKNIDSPEYNFRTIYSRELSAHYYPRSDSRAVADFVNSSWKEGDLVISTLHSPEYYLEHLDYFYRSPKSLEFAGIIACSGTRNIWTNSLMLYKENQLWDTIASHPGNVFFITKSSDSTFKSTVTETLEEKFADSMAFTDMSNKITVYLIRSGYGR